MKHMIRGWAYGTCNERESDVFTSARHSIWDTCWLLEKLRGGKNRRVYMKRSKAAQTQFHVKISNEQNKGWIRLKNMYLFRVYVNGLDPLLYRCPLSFLLSLFFYCFFCCLVYPHHVSFFLHMSSFSSGTGHHFETWWFLCWTPWSPSSACCSSSSSSSWYLPCWGCSCLEDSQYHH